MNLITEYSIILIIPCLVLAFAYSWIFYRKDDSINEIPKWLRNILRGVRFILVALLAFFLLSPMFRYFSTSVQKPVIVFAIDNSQSIIQTKDSLFYKNEFRKEIEQLKEDFGENYDVQTIAFGDNVLETDSIKFNSKRTDFSSLYNYIQATFSNRNVGAIVIASDGIYNSGGNPLYMQTGFKCPVYTVTLGDTVHYKDLSVEDVIYNKVAFKGNTFSIKLIVRAEKSKNSNLVVKISNKQQVISEYKKIVQKDDQTEEIMFDINADSPGLQHFLISIVPVEGEITKVNNYRDIVVDVLESKQKVLLLVNSPHPDAGAMKAALETNPNFELTYSVVDLFKGNVTDFNLVILHQLPSKNNTATQIIQNAINAKVPMLFIIGSQTSLSSFNRIETGLQINQTSQKYEEAYPIFNTDFVQFQGSFENNAVLKDYPPLNVPFGDYKIKSGANILFQQRIKSITTSKPLFLFFDNFFDNRIGIICGEGLWRWRLRDYNTNTNHDIFYELINKITQYLSLKVKKERFSVSFKNVYPENEQIVMGAELYNENFEPVNEPDVMVEIKSSKNIKYPYSFNKTGQFYQLNAGMFPPGDYTFKASTKLGDKKFEKSGKFIVSAINIESSKLVANQKLMEQLALKNGGKYFNKNELNKVRQEVISNKDIKSVSYPEKKLSDFIELKYLFFSLILLLSFEWFIRKYFGTY